MLTHAIIIALACNGLFMAFHTEGLVLYPIRCYLLPRLPLWLCKPMFECVTCMASIYTVLYCLMVAPMLIGWQMLWLVPVVAVVNNLICKALSYGL